ILGLTIDYGPYGFMDAFQANHICNHSDTQGRYAWNAQPSVANWNLYRLASSLLGLGIDAEALKAELAHFEADFLETYQGNLCKKLGLLEWQPGDEALIDDWWALLHGERADFTLSFRALATAPEDGEAFLVGFEDRAQAQAWLDRYRQRLAQEARPVPERMAQMNGANPVYVLRNHLAQAAIEAAQKGDASEIDTLLKLLRNPYVEQAGYEAYAAKPPEHACQLEVSCSS
ncbi:MAG TPA: protein adenylyltransferase SelO family protein, partial [Candidimonas sp.]|nr:protein adenylyltransferase SelO family protein [Candidimonas sp.]